MTESASEPPKRGLVYIFTGDGKGKTSAALGVVLRALGHGLRVYISFFMKGDDPYVLHHVGEMSVNIETAHLWLRHVARLWETGRHDEAKIAGSRARHTIEHLAEATVKHCNRACGARCLNRPGPLERVYRDLSFYVRHDNDDHILATIGKEALGQAHDPSFYKP